MPMKRIIIQTVQRVDVQEGETVTPKRRVTAVFRFAVTDPAQRVPRPDIVRSLHTQAPWDDVVQLQTGAEVERLESVLLDPATSQAQTRTALVDAWGTANTEFQSELPGKFYGAYFDGTWRAREN